MTGAVLSSKGGGGGGSLLDIPTPTPTEPAGSNVKVRSLTTHFSVAASAVSLSIAFNGTSPAEWDAKLGHIGGPVTFRWRGAICKCGVWSVECGVHSL